MPDRHASDRWFACKRHAQDRTRSAVEVDSAVLHVEHNRIESLPRQSLGDGRLIHGDPSAQSLPAGSQTIGEHIQHRLVHSHSR